MGIKVVPVSKESKANNFQKDWKKWAGSEPTPPEGMSDLKVKMVQGKIKPGIKPEYTPPKKKTAAAGPGIRLAIGGPIENPMEKKQKPLYEEELGMYGGGSVRKKMYARGGSTRPTRG